MLSLMNKPLLLSALVATKNGRKENIFGRKDILILSETIEYFVLSRGNFMIY